MRSLCETWANALEVRTPRSRFLLCELSLTTAAYPKYPPQPVVRCDGYRPRDDAEFVRSLRERQGSPHGAVQVLAVRVVGHDCRLPEVPAPTGCAL